MGWRIMRYLICNMGAAYVGWELPGPTLLAVSYYVLYRGIVYYATRPLQP